MACDVDSKYLLCGIPYLRKQNEPPVGMQLGHYYTKKLTKTYHNTNRNVTTDNWFTFIPLVSDLLNSCGMTLVGTVRANKPQLPKEMTKKAGRKAGSSAFCFTKDSCLVSYKPETGNKLVLLLSSMHSLPTTGDGGKPEIIHYYNHTKGAVDTFDQMCGTYSCSRKTKRWSLCFLWLSEGCNNKCLDHSLQQQAACWGSHDEEATLHGGVGFDFGETVGTGAAQSSTPVTSLGQDLLLRHRYRYPYPDPCHGSGRPAC